MGGLKILHLITWMVLKGAVKLFSCKTFLDIHCKNVLESIRHLHCQREGDYSC